jgi:hypothetical protein
MHLAHAPPLYHPYSPLVTTTNNHVLTLFHEVRLQAFKFPLSNFYLGMGNYKPSANEIQQANMITLEKDRMSFFPKKLFHMNEFWNNFFATWYNKCL